MHIHRLPNEVIAMILEELPHNKWTDHTIPQVSRRWRDIFYRLPHYPWRVQTFPAVLPDRLREDAYYIDYWNNFKARRQQLKAVRVVWVVPSAAGFYQTRIDILLSKFMYIFPTNTWESLHKVPYPTFNNMSISERMWPENREAYPVLKRVKISGRLD
ncbi:hypothetical protein CPB86DRAFT_797305 [Serendipita vermifera]|nr:hypothetical protein CPB86DRAFT_797305 [Serendipita vermifera]